MGDFWLDKQVFVTGAGGFIGSHLVERLHSEGAQVRAFVRYNSRGDLGLLSQVTPRIRDEIQIIGGDIRDFSALIGATKNVDIVFHLGALISIPYSYLHPREVAESNFLGTLNILMACQQNDIARMVHTSTSEVYGTARYVPIDESHPLQGQSPYSASKIGADKIVESYFCTYNLPVVTVRPFNTFGPRQSARAVIPTIITQALAGDSIKLGNLETTRDFTYIEDTVDGFLKAAQQSQIEGDIFNLGTGTEIRVGDLADMIIAMIGKPIKIKTDSQRLRPEKSEVFRLLSDNSYAKDKLKWQPRVSLEEGLLRTVEWIRGHLDTYKIGKYEF